MAKGKVITGLDAAANARTGLSAAYAVRAAELWGWEQYLGDPDNVRELHDMRIAAKRLRYLFEFYEPALSADFSAELMKFKRLQDYLGDIHDCDVWVEYLLEQLRDALKEINRSRRELSRINGAQAVLSTGAADLAAVFAGGPAHGLLMFIAEIADRRTTLYAEFLGYWAELKAAGFRDRLTGLVDSAVKEGSDG